MAKTLLTQKIESALKVWHPANYGGYRVDLFRQGFDALEVPVECGSIKSGLVDFVRVQECFTSETKCGTCKLSMYRDEDRDLVMPSVRQWTQEVSCPKDIANWSFRNEPCTERFCRLYKTKHTYTIDTVITCVEIKVSVSDFHSDHGHNFVGHCNYYAMPLALYKKVKDEIPDGIGVLLYYNGENTCGIRKKIECKPRQLSEKTQKWLIMSVAERAEDFVGDLNQVFVVADSAGAFLACMASSILRYPVKMQPVEDELEENVPEAAKKLVINAMGLQSGMYYIYKGRVGLLQNYYMSKGWKNHSYAEFIKPETYSKLIPPCYICTGKKDFLKKQTFGFKKCLEDERVHHDYGFVSKRETVHAFAALYPETESAVGVNREMIRFFDTFKK